MDDNTYDFDLAKAPQTIIKVIGVGGGGGNAVSICIAKVSGCIFRVMQYR